MNHKERIAKIEEECRGVWGQSGVTAWERDRLEDWKHLNSLSPKQEAVLASIENKVFGENDDA